MSIILTGAFHKAAPHLAKFLRNFQQQLRGY